MSIIINFIVLVMLLVVFIKVCGIFYDVLVRYAIREVLYIKE